MFGYVKPVTSELLVREYEFYRAAYCGVCRSMKKNTGMLSNVLHSYDSVFLALVRMLYVKDSDIGVDKRRCIAHPAKKRAMLKPNDAIDYTARAFSILTYYKIRDDVSDEKIIKRAAANALRPIFSGAKRRAGLIDLASLTGEKLSFINKLESEKCASVDEPAKLFGEILGAMFSEGLEGSDKKITYTLGYHLGKFIYCADAAEDYERDKKTGSYNPYVIMYEGKELTKENRETIKCALLLECRGIESAVNLLPFGTRATIENLINNIIYYGLPKRIAFLDCDKTSGVTKGEIQNEQ